MSDLGQMLREARERKQISFEAVEEATRIRQRFLQALEQGDYGDLPGETYVRGFLRTYAIYLELDPEEVMALYEGREGEGKATPPQPGFFQPMDLSMAAPPWLTPDLLIGAILVVVLLAFGTWATWRYLPPVMKTQLLSWRTTATVIPSPTAATPVALPALTPSATPTTVPTAMPTAAPTAMPSDTPTTLPTVVITVEPTATPTSLPTSTSTSVPTSAPTDTPTSRVSPVIEVELRIVEYAWLRVLVDGEEVFVGSLEAGTMQTWRGRESVVIRCGNAGGVEAIVNGEPLGLLGERGQVVDVEWLAEGVSPAPEAITPTVTPSS